MNSARPPVCHEWSIALGRVAQVRCAKGLVLVPGDEPTTAEVPTDAALDDGRSALALKITRHSLHAPPPLLQPALILLQLLRTLALASPG